MYNLLIGFEDGTAARGRVGEYTEEAILTYIAPGGTVDPFRLVSLPTLVMPEVGNSERQVARVGHIEDLVPAKLNYRFRFVSNPTMHEIDSDRIVEAATRLDITDWEFRRTHWAVKDVDLYRVLQESIVHTVPVPRVFSFPIGTPQEPDLVAVMMPFEARFDAVYTALSDAVVGAGMRLQRADDIWDNDHIMQDIVDLIWRARVVISDFSSKSPNVFYETGIAHTLGRDVIQIAQAMNDVPFDLQGIRSLQYLLNGEGLDKLKSQVSARLRDLAARN